MAASRKTNPSESESSNSIMQILLDRVKEDPDSSIFFDDICKELNLEPQGERTMFGKYLKVLFPHVKSRRVCRGTGASRTKSKLFEGIALRTPDELRSAVKREVVQFQELVRFVPNSVLVLSSSPVELILGVPSTLFCNGNLVLKIITISNSKWELSISGSPVDLKSKYFQISHDFFADKEGLQNVINIVRKFRVCCGYPVETGREIRESTCKKLLRERSTFEDHVDIDVLRSWRCERILTFAQYKNSFCRQCFQDCHDLHRNKDSEEASQENKQSNEVDAENLLESDEEAFANGPAQMQQFLKCQLDALKCYAMYAGKGQKGFPHCWDKTFLSLCVSVWMTSKQAYQILESSGMMILPTVRQLRGYKKKMLAAANPEEILPRLPQRRYQWRRFFAEQAPESELGGVADHNFVGGDKVSKGKTSATNDQKSQETEMTDCENSASSPVPQLKMDCEEAEHDFDVMTTSNHFDEHPHDNHHQSMNQAAHHQKNQGSQTKHAAHSQSKQSQEKERAPKRLKTVANKHLAAGPQAVSDKHLEPTQDASEKDDSTDTCSLRKPTLLKLSKAIFQFHCLTANNPLSLTSSTTAATGTRTTTVASSGAAAPSVIPVQRTQVSRDSNESYPEPFPIALFPAHGHVHPSMTMYSNPNKQPFTPATSTITRFPVSLIPPQVLSQQLNSSEATIEPATFSIETRPGSTVSTDCTSANAGTTSTIGGTSITSPRSIKVESSSPVPTHNDDADLYYNVSGQLQ